MKSILTRPVHTALLTLLLASCMANALAEKGVIERDPSEVMSYRGAAWLERPERDEEERPYEVIERMKLEAGGVVADIGCGTGYYARKIAKEVGDSGKVYGVDIQPEMLEYLKEYCTKEGVTNVVPVLGETANPNLPAGSCDWMILADVYHEFQDPEPMLEAMRNSLKPDGRIVLLEYRLEGDSAAHIKKDHRMSVEQVLAEWEPAGFELIERYEFLPSQHFFVFRKAPMSSAPETRESASDADSDKDR